MNEIENVLVQDLAEKGRGRLIGYLYGLLVVSACSWANLAFSDDHLNVNSTKLLPFSYESEEKVIELAHAQFLKLMRNAKNVEVFANPERKPTASQNNRCQMVADRLVKGQISSISKIPYESSTQFADPAKNSSGLWKFFDEAYSKYGGCSTNVFSDVLESDFRLSDEDPVDEDDPHSYRLIRLKNILLLVRISSRDNEPKIDSIVALKVYEDHDGYLSVYVDGKLVEQPHGYCADNFYDLHPWRKKRSFIATFPLDGIFVAAFFKETAATISLTKQQEKEIASSVKFIDGEPVPVPDLKLPNWVPARPDKSLLALHFLDNPENYLNKYRAGGLGIRALDDSDCILEFQPNTPNGDKK